MEYLLARKQNVGLMFVCGDEPQCTRLGFDIERAKRFESPGEALQFRAGMEARLQNRFLVHELDGTLLQSLDV